MARLGTASLVALVALCVLCCAASSAADLGALRSSPSCDRALGQCAVGSDEEDEFAAGLGGGEASLRRAMAQRQPTNRYISYAALRADQVPCNQRGRSYYSNCASQQPANPYRRGCSAITRCARNTN
ncbi:protein RALF-like 19 [Panicum virgatum]|uniref:Protein RALF-like 33 n=1 Tax=Panicum virgatum TaxID=38727 RepID=A0A8T0TUZ8_PANVG|nr:protein RALF-like 19 [Panicum virgatum]KAG2615791.1 hypothetical protein PVAP13_3NG036600 [Panicum virgatum]